LEICGENPSLSEACGNPVSSRTTHHVSITTAAIAQELHRDALLTLKQLTTSITVLALHGSHRQEDTPRVRAVFEQLLETINQAEIEMAVLTCLEGGFYSSALSL